MRLLNDLIKLPIEELEENKYYANKFRLTAVENVSPGHFSSIINTINGVSNYISSIYGKDNIPRDLEDACKQAKAKRENYEERESQNKIIVPENQILKSKFRDD